MTMLLENKKSAEAIQVMIRFKLSPKMFEVILTGMSEIHEYGRGSNCILFRKAASHIA
jgi:hypothetical protein